MQTDRMLLKLTYITIVFAFVVIVLGAYTRLSDAGLGCPDWPGCYGKLVMPADGAWIDQANELYPHRPLEHGKAWKEMIHRYAAGILGLLILAMSVIAWKRRQVPGQQLAVPMILPGLVVFQALLGMWTVTLLLKPVIVMGHLLGGMTLFLLLFWQLLREKYRYKTLADDVYAPGRLFPWAILGLTVVYLQISLGGWTSANYAALVCPDLPACQGSWWPEMDFREGFMPWRGLGVDYEFGVLDTDARTAIHVSHRLGAVLTLFALGAIGTGAMRDGDPSVRRAGIMVLVLLLVQLGLGVANIILIVPISIAVAHNAAASLLLASVGVLLFHTKYSKPDPGMRFER